MSNKGRPINPQSRLNPPLPRGKLAVGKIARWNGASWAPSDAGSGSSTSTTPSPPGTVQVLSVTFAGTGGSSPWKVLIQIVDQDGNHATGRYWCRLSFGATEYGHNDSDASNAITIDTASDSVAVIANEVVDVESNASGYFDLTAGASSDRYLTIAVMGYPAVSSGLMVTGAFAGGGPEFNTSANSAWLAII